MIILLNKFIADKRGGVLIFIALAMGMLFAAMGIAIDMGRVFLVRTKAQTSIDAALISVGAAAVETATAAELQAKGEEYFNANFPDGYLGSDSVTPTFTANGDGTVRGTFDVKMDTLFGPVIDVLLPKSQSVKEVNMGIFSEVSRVVNPVDIEIALVLDYTASMCFEYDAASNTDNGMHSPAGCNQADGKYQSLVKSVDELVTALDTLKAESDDVEIYYSFVPFAHTVNVNGDIKNNNAIRGGPPDWAIIVPNPMGFLPPITGLRQNGREIVNTLKSGNPGNIGNTNTPIGTYWGWLSLRQLSIPDFSHSDNKHENSSEHPAVINTPDVIKIMIIMTDGANSARTITGSTEGYSTDILANEDQRTLCRQIHNEAIAVYSIVFMEDDPDVNDVFKSCANPSDNFFSVTSPAGLSDAFQAIVNDLIDLRITK